MNKLTVVISFLNEGKEVENTLNSIRDTAGDQVDIILINDASTDTTDYESVAKRFNALYLKNQIREGVAASRDKGISQTQTPYFLLLDAHMRFYQRNWANQITDELNRDDRVLLCCNTKVLRIDDAGELDESDNSSAFGAKINLGGTHRMLDSEWVLQETKPDEPIEDIACVLGAGYAASKRYWQHLRGLEGLIYYGCDEAYISLKVWLEGGRCRLIKNISIGHIYRKQAPYKIEDTHSIFNKLLIADLLLPFPLKIRIFGALCEKVPSDFKEAFRDLLNNKDKLDELRQHYNRIFTLDFNEIVRLNDRKAPVRTEEQEEEQKQRFRQVLLNCNTLKSNGLWEGRMGCLLFLVQNDHIQNNDLYRDLTGELIDDIYANIGNSLNIDLGEGLCGIALGIAWLLHHNLMEGDINDILEEADCRIMERAPLRITDYSWRTGLAGILYYVLYRLQIAQEQHLPIPFDPEYLEHLYRASLTALNDPEKAESFEMASWFTAWTENKTLQLEIPDLVKAMSVSHLEGASTDLSSYAFKNGLAGLGLSMLSYEKTT